MNATTVQVRSEEDLRWLSVATLVASVLSLVGGLGIAYGIAVQTRCCRCHQSQRSRENPTITTLILSMTIADLLQSITFIAGAGATLASSSTAWMYSHPVLCEAQGFILQVFVFATPMWVLAISITLHRLVVKSRESGFKFLVVVSAVCWGTALLLGIVPFTFSRDAYGGWSGYGPTGAWCWIHSTSTASVNGTAASQQSGAAMLGNNTAMVENFEQWLLFYAELVIIFFTVLGFSLHMAVHIRRQYATSQMWGHWKKRQGHVIRRLLLFPFCFMLAWSGGITSHVWSLFHPNQVNFALGIFHACTVCSQGWLNAVAYGATNQKLVRAVCEHWAQTCCRCCRAGARDAGSHRRHRRDAGALGSDVDYDDNDSGGALTAFSGHHGGRMQATALWRVDEGDDDLYDDDDDISTELSRSTSASEMVTTPVRSAPASVENIRTVSTSTVSTSNNNHNNSNNRDAAESVSSRSSLPAGTSPYSLLRM
jgi:hypothetical protein